MFLSTFSVDKKSPAELKHISDVTGQAPARQNRGKTFSEVWMTGLCFHLKKSKLYYIAAC